MEVKKKFHSIITNEPEQAIAVAAIQTLLEVVKLSTSNTVMGLREELEHASKELQKEYPKEISLASGCKLFSIFLSRMATIQTDFTEFKKSIIESADLFAKMSTMARSKICKISQNFIKNGSAILTIGFSRSVWCAFKTAASRGVQFRVLICEGKPSRNSYKMLEKLKNINIPVTFGLDTALALMVEKCDFVLVGAEAVVENGGVVSQIGTFSTAMIAKTLKKPYYVAAESFKFSRMYPLKQEDMTLHCSSSENNNFAFNFPNQSKYFDQNNNKKIEKIDQNICENLQNESKNQQKNNLKNNLKNDQIDKNFDNFEKNVTNDDKSEKIKLFCPTLDYTPPEYISLLLTDLGVKTTSAVSDELIKLYY